MVLVIGLVILAFLLTALVAWLSHRDDRRQEIKKVARPQAEMVASMFVLQGLNNDTLNLIIDSVISYECKKRDLLTSSGDTIDKTELYLYFLRKQAPEYANATTEIHKAVEEALSEHGL